MDLLILDVQVESKNPDIKKHMKIYSNIISHFLLCAKEEWCCPIMLIAE